MRYNNRIKPLIKYRFKDRIGCVFFRTFHNDHEARMWYELNKVGYALKEFGSVCITYNGQIQHID